MESRTEKPALLVLEDGRSFRGVSFGATGETFGEAVFTTAMSGYQETLTDPSYHGQVVVATAPQIGNTGWNDDDDESRKIWVRGFVVRELSRISSNWRALGTLADEMAEQGILGISGLDTRALTRHLRERGAMRVGISTEELDPERLLAKVLQQPTMVGANLMNDVTVPEPVFMPAEGTATHTVAALDLGVKSTTIGHLNRRGIDVHLLPASATFADIEALDVDGVFFSNGPGDPATADGPVGVLKQVLDAGIPYFGICFGNQLFGRALGFGTYKLTYGHRGVNIPVMELADRSVAITSQNHGFAVDAPREGSTTTPWGEARVSHVCLNDDVVEGLELRNDAGRIVGFSVQYHPEAAAGPHDSAYLFDRFIEVMDAAQHTEEN